MYRLKNKKFIALLVLIIIFITIIIVTGFFLYRSLSEDNVTNTEKIEKSSETTIDEEESSTESASLVNPASAKCKELGGKLTIQTRGDGGEYGVCEFENGNTCEEWALFKDFCPVGGIEIEESATDPEKYCLQAGGEISTEGDLCELPDGNSCYLDKYFEGGCE